VAEVAGIRVSVHATFLLLISWFAVAYWLEVGNLARVAAGVALLLLQFGCVLLATRLDDRRATHITARLGQSMAALFALIGWYANPLLILIALFVWTGASQEAAMADTRATLPGIPVAHLMLTAFRTLTPEDLLSTAIELMQHGGQHDFPVTHGGRVVGLLTRRDLVQGVHEGGPQSRVADAMERDILVVAPQRTCSMPPSVDLTCVNCSSLRLCRTVDWLASSRRRPLPNSSISERHWITPPDLNGGRKADI
jgi:hypothetical protein